MSQKTEKPVLSGQRIKTRKRDEKEKNDPAGFRDYIVQGLNSAGDDLEAVYKFLDTSGSKLDYRRYGEALFDILIAGGLLVPGGTIAQDGEKLCKTATCIFETPDDMVSMRNFEQVFVKLMRRYKYLEKIFYEEMKKILIFIKGFGESERIKLARMTALWIANGTVPVQVLSCLMNEHLIKDGLALDFIIEVFVTWKLEKGLVSMMAVLKKSGLEKRLMELVPSNRRTEEYFKNAFDERGLNEIVKLHLAQESEGAKKALEQELKDMLSDQWPIKDIVPRVNKICSTNAIPDYELVVLLWTVIMGNVEWNKKEELLNEQAVKHLKEFTPLVAAFANGVRPEVALIVKIQEYCYDNMNFMKLFHKIILLFYKTDVLSEESILKWYKEAHSHKGKIMFLQQLKQFVEWLQNAEEESESDESDTERENGPPEEVTNGVD